MKHFRHDNKYRYLENCKELLQYVVENKLSKLELPLHNLYFVKLYHKKKAASSNNALKDENISNMDMDIQKVDIAVQTD